MRVFLYILDLMVVAVPAFPVIGYHTAVEAHSQAKARHIDTAIVTRDLLVDTETDKGVIPEVAEFWRADTGKRAEQANQVNTEAGSSAITNEGGEEFVPKVAEFWRVDT